MAERWRRCSACKSDIALGAIHWVCSVSTCNRKRTALVFCNVDCWEVHLPTERHREAWAIEARAPMTPDPPPAKEAPKSARPAGSSSSAPASRPSPSAPKSSPSPTTLVRKRGAETATPVAAAQRSAPASAKGNGGEILVVASRLKAYIKNASGFNTSDGVLPVLSAALREICDEAIENARRAEQLTVMGRDVPRD
mgnify:CR=1 FL=1